MPRSGAQRPERPDPLDPSQKLLVLAVALMPLQSALTYDAGFPLKISEVLVIAAVALSALSGWLFRDARRFVAHEKSLLIFGGVVLLSALATFARQPPVEQLHGFTRSATVDALLYTFYGALVITMWASFRRLPRDVFVKALMASVWIAAFMVTLQIMLSLNGGEAVLSRLGYHSVPPGHVLPGIGVALPRNGPFVEGQHLGFYCGVMFFVALAERRRWAAAACLAMLVVSQSTTGFLGIALGYVIALSLRPSATSAVRLVGAAVVGAVAIYVVPALRTAVQIQLGKLGLVQTQFDFLTKSIDLRAVKTDIGFRIMWDNPLIGVGPGRYGVAFYDYVDPRKVTPDYFQPSFRALAENVYAQIGAEFGVIALIAFFWFVLGYVLRLAKLGLAVGAAAAALALGLTTQSDWTFLPAWTLLAYFSVVAAGEARMVDEQAAPDSRLRRRRERGSRAPVHPRR